MTDSYRQQFEGEERADYYDHVEYAPGSYSQVLWQIEKKQLAEIVRGMRSTHKNIDYLDFAAGTGRIIHFMSHRVDSATAIEISSVMAEQAREGLERGNVLCVDITQPDIQIEQRYDLITAFRFFLNAEPTLRASALDALVRRLRDEHSLLVFNNHGNLRSLKALGQPFRFRRRRHGHWQASGNVMTEREVRALTESAGLEIIKVVGCGVLTGRVAKHLSSAWTLRLETLLSAVAPIAAFGVNQMYITRLNKVAKP